MDAVRQAEIRGESTLRVGTLRFRVHHVSAGLPPTLPDRDALSDAIESVLHDTLDAADSSYWVIRRLNLPFRAEPDPGLAHLVEEFARTLRAAVCRILAGEVVDGVRRYDSRAHWLADCLWAQACGTASGQWQFGRYRHHDQLPPGDAVRLILAEEGVTGLAALGILADDQKIRPFCDRIGDAAARGVLRVLLPSENAASRAFDEQLRRVLAEERTATPRRRYSPILAAIARYSAGRPDRPLPGFDVAMRMARAGPSLVSRSPGVQPSLATRQSEPVAIPDAVGDGRRDQAPGDRQSSPEAPESDHPSDDPAILETGFAGVFVLWRSVIEMDLLSLLPNGAEGGPARLALAAAMTGPDHEVAWADPALHWLCGYQPLDDRAPPPPADLALRFVAHFADRRYPQPVEPTLTRVGRTNVLQDRTTEDWLLLGDRRMCRGAARVLGETIGTPAPEARDPSVDLHWFGVAHRRQRRAWVLLARATYGDFARRLYGLQGSSAAWLWDKLLAGWGALEPGSPLVMTLPSVQLDLVLRMGGLDGTVIDTPGGAVRLQLPGAG